MELGKDLNSCCWLHWWKETPSQGMWVVSESWKRKMEFSPRTFKILDLGPMRLISDF